MLKDQIEFYLSRGDILSYIINIDDKIIREITLYKEAVNERLLKIIDRLESPTKYFAEKEKRNNPYRIIFKEYNSGDDTFEMNLDEYRQHIIRSFSSINDVNNYIITSVGEIEEIKWIIYRKLDC